MTTENANSIKKLKRSLLVSLLSLFGAMFMGAGSTFAWYVYNTVAHTTKVQMAVGSIPSLVISDSYDGEYGETTSLGAFSGELTPVSTNKITAGFQKVFDFTESTAAPYKKFASIFNPASSADYYRTSVYVKSTGVAMDLAISDIEYTDSSATNPISTAIRLGVVVHEPGYNKPVQGEYIFEINDARNPKADYNTLTGMEGYVLDSSKTDGTTVPFSPCNRSNFCSYDESTGVVDISGSAIVLAELLTADDIVEIEFYIYLEGCDSDCVQNLSGKTLSNIAVSFAGKSKE